MEQKEKETNLMKAAVDRLPRSLFRDFKLHVCNELNWSTDQWENRYYGRTKATPAEIIIINKLAKKFQRTNL